MSRSASLLLVLFIGPSLVQACPDTPMKINIGDSAFKGKRALSYKASSNQLRLYDNDGTAQLLRFDPGTKEWSVEKDRPGYHGLADNKMALQPTILPDGQDLAFSDNVTKETYAQAKATGNQLKITQGGQTITIVGSKDGFDLIYKPCNNDKFSGCATSRLNLRKLAEGSKGLGPAPSESSGSTASINLGQNVGDSMEYGGCGLVTQSQSGSNGGDVATGGCGSPGIRCPFVGKGRN